MLDKLMVLGAAVATAQHTPFTPVNLTIQQCTSAGCTPTTKRVALDSTSAHTAPNGDELIAAKDDSLTLTYNSAVGGPRVYLIEEEGTNENFLFKLKTQEFTFDVELSTMPCGFNAALYFTGMDANSGGAEDGTNYCDAQAVAGVFCSEMDIMEANIYAQQYTTHGCIDACGSFSTSSQCKGGQSNICDQSGCGLNPFRYGPGTTWNAEYDNPTWYGPGAGYQLDSTQQYTVVTQFHAESATATLTNITRYYVQNGKRVDLPPLYVLPPTDGQHMRPMDPASITADYCTDIYDRWAPGGGPLTQMGTNMNNGMVLAMSAWYDQEVYPLQGSQTGMSWLDGLNDWGKYIKAGPCNATTNDAGTHHATFSNIRIGDIGTTTQ